MVIQVMVCRDKKCVNCLAELREELVDLVLFGSAYGLACDEFGEYFILATDDRYSEQELRIDIAASIDRFLREKEQQHD